MVAGVVYFSVHGSFVNGVGEIKIGHSRNVHNHIAKIKGNCFNGLSLVRTIVTKDCFALKRKILSRLENFGHRVGPRGGKLWFNLTLKQIKDVCEFYEEEEEEEEEEDDQYKVEEITGHQGCAETREYLTKWLGWPEPTWTPQSNFFTKEKGNVIVTDELERYWVMHPYLRVHFNQDSLDSEDSESEDLSGDSSNDEESEDNDYESSSSSDSEELDADLEIYD